jgi:DNA-binding CsgD family transcriptional regulator/pimeloyl-ACP methyl ester carboxylesterase
MSDREDVKFSFEHYLEDVEAVATAAGFDKYALFGIGGPAALAVAYAARRPENVTHLVLHAPFARGRVARATTTAQLEEIEAVFRLISLGLSDDDPSRRQMIASQFLPDGTAIQLRELGNLLRVTSSAKNVVDSLRAWYVADISEALSLVACPTLVFHPRSGFRVPLEEGRIVARSIAGARLIPLKTRNTYPPDDDPVWKQVNVEIDEFMTGTQPITQTTQPQLCNLTKRERAIFEAAIQGLNNKEIARRLKISEKTVRNHLSSVFGKFGVRSRAQLIVQAHSKPLGVQTPPTDI